MSDAPDMGRALAALSIDPGGLGGLVLRARAGPAWAAFEAVLARLPGQARRIYPDTPDAMLFGGIDVAASLSAGRSVRSAGLDATPCRWRNARSRALPRGWGSFSTQATATA